jgi:hypothetical protein
MGSWVRFRRGLADRGRAAIEINYLSQGEIEARNRGYRPYSVETWRTWEYWAHKAGCGHLLTQP